MLSGRNLKQLAIRANVYGIARRVHRVITPHERRQFHGDLARWIGLLAFFQRSG